VELLAKAVEGGGEAGVTLGQSLSVLRIKSASDKLRRLEVIHHRISHVARLLHPSVACVLLTLCVAAAVRSMAGWGSFSQVQLVEATQHWQDRELALVLDAWHNESSVGSHLERLTALTGSIFLRRRINGAWETWRRHTRRFNRFDSAMRLQAAFRSAQSRRIIQNMVREERENSVLLLQSVVSAHRGRQHHLERVAKGVARLKKATQRCQASLRARIGRKLYRCMEVLVEGECVEASQRIQGCLRGVGGREHVAQMHAITKAKATIAQRKAVAVTTAVTFIQALMRGGSSRQEARDSLQQMDSEAAKTLQGAIIGMEARALFRFISTIEASRQDACTRIQAVIRGHRERWISRVVHSEREEASHRIQALVRARRACKAVHCLHTTLVAKDLAAKKMQAIVMGYQARCVVSSEMKVLLSAQRLVSCLHANKDKREVRETRTEHEVAASNRIKATWLCGKSQRRMKAMRQAYETALDAERIATEQAAMDELLMNAILVMGEATTRRHSAAERIYAGLKSMRVRRDLKWHAEQRARRLWSSNRIKAAILGKEMRMWCAAAAILLDHAKTMQAGARGWQARQTCHHTLVEKASKCASLLRWRRRRRTRASQERQLETALLAEALWSQARAWGVWTAVAKSHRDGKQMNMTAGGVFCLKRMRKALEQWRGCAATRVHHLNLNGNVDTVLRAVGLKRRLKLVRTA